MRQTRPVWVMPAALLIIGWALGLLQSAAKARQQTDVVSEVVSLPVMPVANAMNWTANCVSDFAYGIFHARSLRQQVRGLEDRLNENQQLPDRITRLEQEITRLRGMLGMAQQTSHKSVYADIVSFWPEEYKIELNVGAKDGVRAGDPVIHSTGLVGQVSLVSSNRCFAILVTHPRFSVGIRVKRTTSQEIGIARGRGDQRMVVEFLTGEADAQAQDAAITAGLTDLYPEGILVGRLIEVWTDHSTGNKGAYLAPAVNFNKIREARVLIR